MLNKLYWLQWNKENSFYIFKYVTVYVRTPQKITEIWSFNPSDSSCFIDLSYEKSAQLPNALKVYIVPQYLGSNQLFSLLNPIHYIYYLGKANFH